MAFKLKSGVEYRRIGNEGIVMMPDLGKCFRLSPETVESWEALGSGRQDGVPPHVLVELFKAGLLEGDVPSVEDISEQQLVKPQVLEVAFATTYFSITKSDCDSRASLLGLKPNQYSWVKTSGNGNTAKGTCTLP